MRSSPVSVVIPTYNREKFLSRALESVFSQTCSCSEILVIDDGSTDNTSNVVREIQAGTDTPVKYTFQENSGPAAARNVGIHLAEFEFIAFLDSDDHWHKNKIEIQYGSMCENDDYQISHTREKWLRRGAHLNQKAKHIPRHGDIFEHCLELCAVGMSTVMVRKSLFNEAGFFDTALRCCEDYDMWVRVSSKYPFLLIDEPLTIKEGGRDDQVSYQYRVGMDKLRIASLQKILSARRLLDKQRLAVEIEIAKKARIYGQGCLRHGKAEEGRHYVQLADEIENNLMKQDL